MDSETPYPGYQHPSAIDWTRYGPARPAITPELQQGSDQGLDSAVTILLAFFGLLLPGLLGSLAAIGVPLGKIYVAGVSLITMFFLTGHGETLYNEDVSREMVYLVLQLIQEIV